MLFVQLRALFCNQAKVKEERVSHTPRHSFGSADENLISHLNDNSVNESRGRGPSVIGGNGVDIALMKWILSFQDTVLSLKSSFTIKAVIFFSPLLKSVSDDSKYFAHVMLKGAPEYVIDRCSNYLEIDGREVPLTPAIVDAIRANIESAASTGGRVIIAMAKLSLDRGQFNHDYVFKTDGEPNFPLVGLTFICCIAVSDPPRPGVREAVSELRRAGIRIAMVTGDASNTAVAITRQVGIVSVPTLLDSTSLPNGSPSDVENVSTGVSSNLKSTQQVVAEEGGGSPALLVIEWWMRI